MLRENPQLKFKRVWLLIGYILIMYIIYSSLSKDPVNLDVSYFDKYAHTFAYFVLMGWFIQIYHTKKSRYFWGIFFISMGISLEFLQGLTGYRYFDTNDMLANMLGVTIAWILAHSSFEKILLSIDQRLSQFR